MFFQKSILLECKRFYLVLFKFSLCLLSISHLDTFLKWKFRYSLSFIYVFFLNVVYNSVLSAKFMILSVVLFCKLLMQTRKNKGPETEPCGTPVSTFSKVDVYPAKSTNCFYFSEIRFHKFKHCFPYFRNILTCLIIFFVYTVTCLTKI